MSMNQWLCLGRMTRDPEIRYTAEGAAVAGFAVACNNTWTGRDGQKHEEVFFMECSAFSHTADFLAKYVTKGDLVFIQGRLKTDEWDDKQTGQKRRATKCNVTQLQLCAKPQGKQADNQPAPTRSAPTEQRQETPAPAPEDDSDSPPF